MAGLIPIVLLFAVMYMLVIRPQQRRVREHASFVDSLRYGEEVVTAGGIFGTITALQEDTVLLEVAPGVPVKVMRSSVTRRLGDEPAQLDDLDDINDVSHLDDLDRDDVASGEVMPELPSTDDPGADRP